MAVVITKNGSIIIATNINAFQTFKYFLTSYPFQPVNSQLFCSRPTSDAKIFTDWKRRIGVATFQGLIGSVNGACFLVTRSKKHTRETSNSIFIFV